MWTIPTHLSHHLSFYVKCIGQRAKSREKKYTTIPSAPCPMPFACYSYLSAAIGFLIAAVNAWKETKAKDNARANPPAIIKIQISIDVRYAKLSNQ
jgi:hypothetical protein